MMQKDHITFCSGVEKEATVLRGVFSCTTLGKRAVLSWS